MAKEEKLPGQSMRRESLLGFNNNLIVSDPRADSDLDSLRLTVQSAAASKKKKKVLVLTDMVDGLGDRRNLYESAASMVNTGEFDAVFLVGEEISAYSNLFLGQSFPFKSVEELENDKSLTDLCDALIILKGDRRFTLEKIRRKLSGQFHDTVLEVNLSSVLHNIEVHRSFLRPETKLVAMLKACSYGLGAYGMAEFLERHHVDYFAVAYTDEGASLRRKGISTPIIVMNPEVNTHASLVDCHLEPEIYSFRILDSFLEELIRREQERKYPIHIKINTGFNRLGFAPKDIPALTKRIKEANVEVASIFSHLSCSDLPEERTYTLEQIEKFEMVSERIMADLGYRPMRHILNSSGITEYPEYQFDMARIGIGLLGCSPNPKLRSLLRDVVCFRTIISQILDLNPADSLGYARAFRPRSSTRIATLPVGYSDGIPRFLGGGNGCVGIRGELFPIVGRVCMDMMMVDIGNFEAFEGEEVIIFGKNPSLEMFSEKCDTIPHEVLTSVSQRVKRLYVED